MTAFLFVPLLAATWIIGLFVSGLLAHYFLTIVESSGTMYAQNIDWQRRSFRSLIRDGVDWPEAEYIDWFWKGLYMLYLVGVWLGPAFILTRWAVGPSIWASVIIGLIFWLTFPVSVLSTMMSSSRWNPCWFPLFGCFAQRPAQTLAFYGLSFLPLAVLVLTADLLLVHPSRTAFITTMLLTPLTITALFVYARLLGRLALTLSFTRPAEATNEETPKPRKRKRRKPLNAYDPTTRWSMPTEEIVDVPVNTQPGDLPAIQTPHDGPVTGYNVDYSGSAAPEVEKPKPTIHTFDDEDDSPITVAPAPEVDQPERRRITEALAKPPQHVLDLYLRDRPTEPANPFGMAAVSFLTDVKTVTAWCTGVAGLLVLTVLLRALDVLRPI